MGTASSKGGVSKSGKHTTLGKKVMGERVERAAKTGNLNLEHAKLTAIPPRVFDIAILKQLDISNNALTTLPPELSGCAKLKILKVAGNKLTSVHYDALFGAPTLQTIDLSGNALTAVPRLPPAAVTVDLSRNAISTVSAEALEPLSMLRELDLSNNQLESLPNLGGMARLGTLNLDDNVLVTLGDDWSGTPKLGVVFARRNRLTAASLPASLFRDTVLQRLELAGNRDMVKTELMVAEGFDAFLERRKARVDKALKADLDPSRDLCGLG